MREVNHPLLEQLDVALRDRVPPDPVEFAGTWSQISRRTYESENQLGTGSRPFADVVDVRWRGALTGARSMSGMTFLLTADNLFWAKAPQISPSLPVEIGLHAYADYTPKVASFTARVGGAYLPGVAVAAASPVLTDACHVEQGVVRTGRLSRLAQTNSAAVFVLLFQRELLKVGRKHLWRVREDVASSLPAVVREVLTRRRTDTYR